MSDRTQIFETVGRIYAGAGSLARLEEAAPRFGRRCVLVTGRSAMRGSGVLDRVTAHLKKAGIDAAVFDAVAGEPDVTQVDAIRQVIAESRADFVVGLGGGSAMDAAKAAAGLASETEPAAAFLREQRAARPGLPVIAIATTSGTGAEATPNAVITDAAAKLKASLRNGRFLPSVAIVDPELTVSCPPRVTAWSGMDAIAQAVESFVSIHSSPLSDAMAFESFRLLWPNLVRAFENGSDIDARAACSYGSLMAGIALANARLGAVHGIAHPLGARYSVPHGLACAVLLPIVVRMNLPCSAEKYARLAQAAGTGIVEGLVALNRRLGIYDDFARYRIPAGDFEAIARESMPSGSLKANPKKFTADDVVRVLTEVVEMREGRP
jgi:alcohol dehydrogenase class IV